MKNIQLVSDSYLCSNCGACSVICHKNAIDFRWSSVGRLYASINDNCVNCGNCLKVCPSLDYHQLHTTFSDKYIGVDEIDFIENAKKEVISSYNLPARSVVLLEFGNNVEITTVLSNGNVYYKANLMAPVNCDLVCGAYKGDVLLNAKKITKSFNAGTTSATINMGGLLTGADNLKLFVWESETFNPVCDVEKYSLNK